MAKSYPEQLGEWVKLRTSTRRDKNLVAFLAVRDDVKAALEAGYAVKTVWANMHECKRVDFGYDTFLNYVNRLIRHPTPHTAGVVTSPASTRTVDQGNSKLKAEGNKSRPKVKGPEAPAGFVFNAAPKKEDLI